MTNNTELTIDLTLENDARNRINKIICGCMTRGMSSEATTDEVWEYLRLNAIDAKSDKAAVVSICHDLKYDNTMLRGRMVEMRDALEIIEGGLRLYEKHPSILAVKCKEYQQIAREALTSE